jgi:hypothetical protein
LQQQRGGIDIASPGRKDVIVEALRIFRNHPAGRRFGAYPGKFVPLQSAAEMLGETETGTGAAKDRNCRTC